jgi:hypothetical protein
MIEPQEFQIRAATKSDVPALLRMIRALADYEKTLKIYSSSRRGAGAAWEGGLFPTSPQSRWRAVMRGSNGVYWTGTNRRSSSIVRWARCPSRERRALPIT